jgi:hypothetical protein
VFRIASTNRGPDPTVDEVSAASVVRLTSREHLLDVHQPGGNQFTGTHRGAAAVNEMLGGMMTASAGTFEINVTGSPMANGLLVTVPVHFSGWRAGAVVDQPGVDLLRVEGDRIAEVWLFSSDPSEEDTFWGAA